MMNTIMDGEATPAQIGGFLVALRLKGETADEIAGCAEAMREHVLRVQSDARRPRRHRRHRRRRRQHVEHLDRSGARRGCRGRGRRQARQPRGRRRRRARPTCSRRSASTSTMAPERIEQSIDELGFGFLFAQAHHPAMKYAAPVRRELATRTVFNVLGPLTNPAGARAQVVGVYAPAVARTSPRRSSSSSARRAYVVHGAGGIDELSPAGPNLVCEVDGGSVREYELDPLDLGVERCDPAELRGGRRRRTRRRCVTCSPARRGRPPLGGAAERGRARSPRAATPRTSARASSSPARRSTPARRATRLDAARRRSRAGGREPRSAPPSAPRPVSRSWSRTPACQLGYTAVHDAANSLLRLTGRRAHVAGA